MTNNRQRIDHNKTHADFGWRSYNRLLKEFNCKDEKELYNLLNQTCETLPCVNCGINVAIDNIVWIDSDIFCPYCGGK